MTMKSTLLTSLVVAGASAAVAAVTTSLIVDTRARPEPASPAAGPVPSPSGTETASMTAELRELREENVALEQRLDDLESLLAQELARRVPVAEAYEAERKDTPASSDDIAAIVGDGSSLPPAFVASVGVALKEIREEEDRLREIKRQEERAARIEERLTQLQEELGLTGYQTGEMRVALTSLEEKREALRQSIEGGGGDRREMFEGFRTLYEETSTQLQTILTPQQFEAYQQSDRGRFGGFGGRDRGRGEPPLPDFQGGPQGPQGVGR